MAFLELEVNRCVFLSHEDYSPQPHVFKGKITETWMTSLSNFCRRNK